MAESALFRSYRATEKAKAERDLDEALGRLEAPPAPAGQPAAEPAQPPAAQPQPEERKPGVFESLKRGVEAVPKRFKQGIDTLGGVIEPITPEERNEDPVDPHGLVLQRSQGEKILQNPVTRTLLGALDSIFPISAFAGEVGGDIGRWLEAASQQSTDAALKTRLVDVDRRLKGEGQGYSPWAGPAMEVTRRSVLGKRVGTENDPILIEKRAIESLLAIPEAERLEHARQMSGIASEVLTGFIPGYTAAVKGGAALLKGGAKGTKVADAAKAPLALTAGTPPRVEGAIPMGGAPGAPARTLEQDVHELMKPAHRQTVSDIVERALEERRAMERQAAERLGEPGANRVVQNVEGREPLREEFRTPLDAGDSAVANEILNATRTQGGATYSPHTGMHPGDSGFAVSIAPERGRVIKGAVTEQDISDFARANEDLLQDKRAYIGTWRDENGRTHLDISIVAPDRGEALEIGRKYRQTAIYDFAGKQSVDIPNAPQGPHPYTAPAEPLTQQDVQAARMYDAAITDPKSKPAWDALAREIDKDFEEISKLVRIEKVTGQPYASADEMAEDIKRGVMKVTTDNSEHPFWDVETNWKFRVVHDYRGHFETGNDFSLGGEFKAWRAHDEKIVSADAKQALQVEVYGQAASAQANSGKFPEQKAFLPKDQPGGGIELPAMSERLGSKPGTKPSYRGFQPGFADVPGFHMYDLKEPIVDKATGQVLHPINSTVSEQRLIEHGVQYDAPPSEVGDPIVKGAAEARDRLRTQWEVIKERFTDERGAINPVNLRGDLGDVISRQTMNDLVTVGTEILWRGQRSFRRWAQAMLDEFGDAIRPFLKDLYPKAQEKIRKVTAKSPDLKSVKQVLQYFHDGEFGAGWYDKAADELRAIFGENAELYADLLAATSPHQTVAGNVTRANQAIGMILSGERNIDAPFTAADGFMDGHLLNLNRILFGQPVEGPKVGAFAQAIKGDRSAVVVDTWMLRAFGFPELAGVPGRIEPSRERVLFIEKVVKDIAAEHGMEPRQAQAAIWVGKKLEVEGSSAAGTDPLHQVVRAKLVNDPALAKMAEEFKSKRAVGATKAPEDAELADAMKAFDAFSEEGRVSLTALLATTRAAIGAAAGASQGENPEQAAFYALLGAGAGSVLSRRLAQQIWTNLKDTDLLTMLKDERGAINPRQIRAERRAAREAMPNVRRMDATKEVKQTARAINDRLSEMRRLLRDTTLTHDETLSRAANSKFRNIDELLAHEKGTTFTRPEDGVAARDTRDLVIEDLLMQAARAKATGDPAEMTKVRERAKLAALVSERVTDATTVRAQAQEAQKIPSRAARAKTVDYDAVARELQDFQSGLDEALVNDADIVNSLLEMGERAKAAKLLEDAKKVPSAFWKIYYGLNLLSTPMFHPKNVIGNTGALALSIGARMVGEVISYPFQYAGVRKLGSKPLIAPGETYDLIVGAVESVKDAWTAGKNTMATGESIFRGNKFGDRMNLIAAQRAIQQPGGAFQVMVDGAARLAEANLRFAGSTDEFYKVLSFAGEQRALARRKAWTSGAETWKDAIEEQARLLRETPKDIIEAAESFAEYNTFTKAFDQEPGKIMSALGAKRSIMATLEDLASHPAARLTIAPFFRTPMRIAEFGTEFTPVLNLVAPKIWADAMSGGANAQLAVAKIAMSAGMTYVLAQYAAAGLISGDWSKDPGLRARQKEAGFKPWSVYVPLIDKYVSYAGLGPIVAPVAAAAQYAQTAPHLKDSGIDTQFMAMMLATMETNLAMPYFDALNDFVQIFESYDDDKKIASGVKYIADRLRTFVPAAGLLRSVATMLDGEVKDLKEFGATISPAWRDVFNLFSSTMVNLPGLSRTVPAYRNIVTGEPIPLEGGPLPGLISTPTDDPVQIEILELGGAGLPKEIPRYIGGDKMPEGSFRVYGPKAGQVAPLSHEQRTKLADLLTKGVKVEGKTLHQTLTALIVGPSDEHDEYVEQSDGARGGKALMIHDVWNAYLDEAEAHLLEEDKGLQETIRRSQAAKTRQGVPPAQLRDFDEMVEEVVR